MEEEEEEFPFNMSDFVTVDEVGDVTELPSSPSAAPMETSEGMEDASTTVQQDTSEDTPMEATVVPEKSDEHMSESEHVNTPTDKTSDSSALPNTPTGPVLDAVVSASLASQGDLCLESSPVPTCQPEEPDADITQEPNNPPTDAPDSTPEDELLSMPIPAASADSSSNSPATGVETAEHQEDEKEDSPLNHGQATEEEEVVSNKQEEQAEIQDKENKETGDTTAETGKTSEDHTDSKEEKTKLKAETAMISDRTLPPYDPCNPVGMEFLVPKTGFFCKVCSRFFSGNKEAEMNHCKSLKHYKSLQAYLQTTETASMTPECS